MEGEDEEEEKERRERENEQNREKKRFGKLSKKKRPFVNITCNTPSTFNYLFLLRILSAGRRESINEP